MCLCLERSRLNCILMCDSENPNSIWNGAYGKLYTGLLGFIFIILLIGMCYLFTIPVGLLGVVIVNKYDIPTGCPKSNLNCGYEYKSICHLDSYGAIFGLCPLVGVIVIIAFLLGLCTLYVLCMCIKGCYISYQEVSKFNQPTIVINPIFEARNELEVVGVNKDEIVVKLDV